jgi:hypothetical protein
MPLDDSTHTTRGDTSGLIARAWSSEDFVDEETAIE